MDGPKPFVLGATTKVNGDITQNIWVGARSARALEKSLGYGVGRLSAGWWVLLLTQALTPADFRFGGLTIRSGGRLGLPADTPAADRLRISVHDDMMGRMGEDAYRKLQTQTLASIPSKGAKRLVKVVPVQGNSKTMPPSQQYPMGGGGLQWTLNWPCQFLVAMSVDANGIARIPGYSTNLGESVPYEERAKLARYLNEA